MKYAIWLTGIIVIGALLRLVWNVTNFSGALVPLEPLLTDRCHQVDIAPGTEDIAIDHETGTLFISAGARRDWYQDDNTATPVNTNGIYAWHPDNPDVIRKVSPPGMTDFLPHGISLWTDPSGQRRLFVVNHPGNHKEHVEIFDIAEDETLTYVETIAFEAMHSPNDVVAVGPRQFYATNDVGYDNGILSALELYLALPFASVVYFDGIQGTIIKSGLTYANGINRSANGKYIYIAEVLGRRIGIYDRHIESGTLRKTKTISTDFAPDNIDVDADGMLWVAGHPKGFAFQAHARDASKVAPSKAVRMNPDTGKTKTTLVSVYGEINGSSVAAADRNNLYVGAVFDGHILACPLPIDS